MRNISVQTFLRHANTERNLSCHQTPLLHSVQEAIIQIMKMRKRISNAQLQTELVEILKNMFLPQKKMIKEQIEWLIEQKYIKRDETDINTFIYMAQPTTPSALWDVFLDTSAPLEDSISDFSSLPSLACWVSDQISTHTTLRNF